MAWRTDLPNHYADDFDYDTSSPVARQLYVHELDEEIASFQQQNDQRFHGGLNGGGGGGGDGGFDDDSSYNDHIIVVRLGDDAFPFRAIGRLAILRNLDNPLDCLQWSSVMSSSLLVTQQTFTNTVSSRISNTTYRIPRVAFELASRYCLRVWLSPEKNNIGKPLITLPSSFVLSNRIALLCRCLIALDALCDNNCAGETLEWMICLERCLHVHACLYLLRHTPNDIKSPDSQSR